MLSDRLNDKIILHDLRFACVIGVNPEERTRKQEISIDVELYLDLSSAGGSDNLEDTVSYSLLADRIVSHAQGSSYKLIESLGEAIAGICLEPERIAAARVLIRKPGAVKRAAYAGIEIYRSKTQHR